MDEELKVEEQATEELPIEEPAQEVAQEVAQETDQEPVIESFEAFDFGDKDLTDYDGTILSDEEPEETAEESPEEPEEEQTPEAETLKAELEAERVKHKTLLEKLNFKDDDEALAYAEGKPIEQIREERAKAEATTKAWEDEDIKEISRAFPELQEKLKGDWLKDLLDDPSRFAQMRCDPDMRKKMSAVDTFEFVNRNRLRDKAVAAGAQKAASKAHLQPTKGKRVTAPVSIPRDVDRMLGDSMTQEQKLKYYKELTS